jgi:hypothetical protein
MQEDEGRMPGDDQSETPRPPPLQFRLRTVFAITLALGVLFGTLRWLGVPELASFIVLVVLAVSVLAAVALVVVIAGGEKDD